MKKQTFSTPGHTKLKSIFIIFLLFLFCSKGYSAENSPRLFINEFLASNQSIIENTEYGEYSDWLEIYNAEDTTVQLGGFYLTDDLSEPSKWRIPDNTSIRPGWHLFFWADGIDAQRHTNFQLSDNGEQLGLYTAGGAVVDTLTYPPQTTDISYGRYPDGNSSFYFLNQPSPGAANSGPYYEGICPGVQFSYDAGFYTAPLSIEISTDNPDAIIRYTLDGALPDDNSPLYTEPVNITSTIVLRARAFKSGYMAGVAGTATYFIGEEVTLPVVSVATDPVNLWDDEIGIYVEGTNGITGYCSNTPKNWNQDWERPVHIEYFEKDGSPGFKLNAGMKIGGGCTRKYPQKTLAIYARNRYGTGKIKYKIFDDKKIDSFNNIVLRNNGQDWYRALLRDGMMQLLVKDRMDIDWQAYQPALLFLNGEYWGIHPLREKHNEHYLAANHGIDPDEIDILSGNAVVMQGSNSLYTEMINFISSADMNAAENYAAVKKLIDINEYLNYLIAEIYFANIDWPGGNIKYWRTHGENERWRWVLFDLDLGFGAHGRGQYDSNTLANATATSATYYANPPWSTLLFRRLLENDDFRSQFIQRFAGHINTTFDPDRVVDLIDSLQTLLAPEIPRHKAKWEDSMSFGNSWEELLDITREFGRKRPEFIISHLMDKFQLSGTAELTITVNDPEQGRIRINNVEIPADTAFTGLYFKDVELQCRAIANSGYRFIGWRGLSELTDESISVQLNDDARLEALFEPDVISLYQGLVINEFLALNDSILADEANEYDDWIELYNNSNREIDIGGLYITDDLENPGTWRIPASSPDTTTIAPGEFLLLWADKQPEQGVLHVDIKLSGDGEAIGLSVKSGPDFQYIDSLTYYEQTADVSFGRITDAGATYISFDKPTPGYNNAPTLLGSANTPIADKIILFQNYPNPFNAETTILFHIAQSEFVTMDIYDISGRYLSTILSGRLAAGHHRIVFDGDRLPSSIYLYKMKVGQEVRTRKLLIIK